MVQVPGPTPVVLQRKEVWGAVTVPIVCEPAGPAAVRVTGIVVGSAVAIAIATEAFVYTVVEGAVMLTEFGCWAPPAAPPMPPRPHEPPPPDIPPSAGSLSRIGQPARSSVEATNSRVKAFISSLGRNRDAVGIEKLLRLRLLVGVVLEFRRGSLREGARVGWRGRSGWGRGRRWWRDDRLHRWAGGGRRHRRRGGDLGLRGKRRRQQLRRGQLWNVSRFFLVSDEERAREDAREEEHGSKDNQDRTVSKQTLCRRIGDDGDGRVIGERSLRGLRRLYELDRHRLARRIGRTPRSGRETELTRRRHQLSRADGHGLLSLASGDGGRSGPVKRARRRERRIYVGGPVERRGLPECRWSR